MARDKFRTVSEELLPFAEEAARFLRTRGYRLRIEHQDIEHPYTPTFLATRARTTLIVEVAGGYPQGRVEEWSRYCRSCSSDTRIALFIPEGVQLSEKDLRGLNERRVGVYRVRTDGVSEILQPHDLAITVELPELTSLPPPVRRLLAPSYEKFERGDWREGFEDACLALEEEARKYLQSGIRSTRITILGRNGKPKTPTVKRVKKMTLGRLADEFGRIQSMNHPDSILAGALSKVNPDRIGVVHRRRSATAERRLRQNVGRLMWIVINALRAIK